MPHTIIMDISKTLDVQLHIRMIIEKLKKLGDGDNEQRPSLEKYVQDRICALEDADRSVREHYRKMFAFTKHPESSENRICSGSMVEGAMTARCFQNRIDWREIEMDLMFTMFTIPQETGHLLESVENKPGFVRLPFSRSLCPSAFYYQYVTMLMTGSKKVPYSLDRLPKYISRLVIKDYLKNAIPASLLRLPSGYGSEVKAKVSQHKTETTLEISRDVSFFGHAFVHISMDCVPSVRLLFWPHHAAAWITRHRRWWPQQDTIQSIVDKGCQLVPRSSPGGNVHTEWRFSFSGPEAILAQLCNEKQQQAYYFFKMFFYRYLKNVESSEHEAKPLYS